MNSGKQTLFDTFQFGPHQLKNRIAMAPMTRSCSPGGVPGQNVAEYYKKRAENDVGLIITEGMAIQHPASVADPNIPRIHGDDACQGWKQVVDEVHRCGGKIAAQIWHIGLMRKPGDAPNPDAMPIGPSGLMAPGVRIAEPMSVADIEQIIEAFADAAGTAKLLGFDGIEIHGAHGYLIDQFFWQATNERNDLYGGSMAKRSRFAVEIIQACRKRVGPDFPILFRFSQWKVQDFEARLFTSPQELDDFLYPLVDAGVDMLHVSTRRFWEPAFEGSPLTLAGWTKKQSGLPVMAVGSIGLNSDFLAALVEGKGAENTGIERVERLIDACEADMVAVGRALLTDPAWVRKVQAGHHHELKNFDVSALAELN
ncbi:NADH:flavin oxidoreductase [Photobacterium sp. 1_MG-2023]|uniref:NADH:flavin oxidoreductase n=1 Tax=Photobacterium sp. 1_MG-2023 TaxID=3062646 RepID=UPI0026E25D6D|nr:NADH:flavin oxidoreductase [Photobacterium sp. 1_MG-2023]MDO6707318.1 NADH:flavin oxidoreductase [Photobacterium sp. 1_MG-2023]